MTHRAQLIQKKRNDRARRETPEFADRDPLAELTALASYLLYSEGLKAMEMENDCFMARLEIRKKGDL